MSGGEAVKTMDSMSHAQRKEAHKKVINRNFSGAINK